MYSDKTPVTAYVLLPDTWDARTALPPELVRPYTHTADLVDTPSVLSSRSSVATAHTVCTKHDSVVQAVLLTKTVRSNTPTEKILPKPRHSLEFASEVASVKHLKE